MSYLLFVPAVAWLLFSAIFFGLGEYLSKEWSLHPSWPLLIFVLLAYIVSVLAWLPVLLHNSSLTTMGSTWLLLGVVFTVMIGVFVYHESMNYYQMTGIAFAVVALLLLNVE